MSGSPPQLGEIPHPSEMNIPTLRSNDNNGSFSAPTTNGTSSLQNARDSMYNSESSSRDTFIKADFLRIDAQSAMNTVQNHPATQNFRDTVSSVSIICPPPPLTDSIPGPVAENIRNQHAITSSEFRNLADSRIKPEQSTATGQPLTHYHSFFYNLLSWENPRATALSFLLTVLSIFAARYLPALRWSFKVLYIILGAAAAAEVAGKLVLSRGLASSFRPRKYYTIPRESLETCLGDVEQLINFFVIEFQRILFAENVMHTIAAFLSTLISYWLVRFVPFWGLSLIAVSVIYLAPLIYITNKELIDHHIENATNVVNSQASQVKELAGHHTARATETVKAYAGDYSAKAQEYIGSARGRSSSPEVSGKSSANTPLKSEPGSPQYHSSDFPHAPKQEPTEGVTSHAERYQNSQFGGQAETVS
ncbi:hypothetical protein MMC06_003261 [Schaereria dolodes]|nr:hypothetical protein [Schaereria dolodes]